LIFDQRRLETLGRIFQAGGVAQERVITKERVVVGGVAPLLTNRFRSRRKRKAAN
jgi:hypothetical protein